MSQYNVNVAKSRLSVGFVQNDKNFLNLWEKNQTFNKVNQSLTGKPFVLLDGPPYANGEAHLGHALNKLFKDLVVKSQWFNGRPVSYRPGWDCHGLPLELAVEKKYGKLDTETLKTRCKQLAFRSLVKQRKSFKKLGVLGQWDTPYVTLSSDMVKDSWKTVQNLLQKDLLEYKRYPVHYCPACSSSLAEAELENKVLNKDSLFFKMELKNSFYPELFAVVWTTTPWTLPMNQGLAYNENFEYFLYQKNDTYLVTQKVQQVQEYLSKEGFLEVSTVDKGFFNNLEAVSPVTGVLVPVLHADFVESGKTGFVHLAFSHGPEDFELGQSHKLEPVSYLSKSGFFDTELNSLAFLNGKKYTQVQSLVCTHLSEKEQLVHYSNSQVEQQVCWRHKCGVYYNATYQGFLKLETKHYNLKEKVKVLLEKSHLQLSQKERLGQMLLNRKNWCLSRQRKWGCPMNLIVHKESNKLNVKLSLEYLELCLHGEQLERDVYLNSHNDYYLFDDVLDVWFDSGNVVNNYANNNDHQSEDYVVDLVLEGKDQFRGWFQSLLWLSVASQEKMPYKNLFCHGFVLDENRNKFSKSSGNGSPVEHYLNQFGADVLHLWVASQEPELDAVFSDKKLEEMKKYYSRLRLCLRFLTSNLYDYDVSNHEVLLAKVSQSNEWDLHRHLLKEISNLKNEMSGFFNQYQFKKALEALYFFCDKTLSNFYFDWVKNPLYLLHQKSELRVLHQAGLYEVLMATFDMVKVFTPFVAEEFYQDFFTDKNSVLELSYFNEEKVQWLNNLVVLADWNKVQETRKLTQSNLEPLQKEKKVKSRTEVGVELSVCENDWETFNFVNSHFKLSELLSVSFVHLHKSKEMKSDLVLLNQRLDYQKCPRCWNYEHTSNFFGDLCNPCNNQN